MTPDSPFAAGLRIREIFAALPYGERKKLQKRFDAVLSLIAQERSAEEPELIRSFLQELESSYRSSPAAGAEKLVIEYPLELPITDAMGQLKAAFEQHQVIIVCGATGSGKTTQLPKLALECGCGRTGRIGCTQPRRIAATSLAQRFAEETSAQLGKEVGCKIRFDDKTGPETCVKFMTDGILLAETRNDPKLYQYDCLILDEVHERSLNIDFLLGYLKNLLPRRKDLHLVIASATLEAEKFLDFFTDAVVVEVPGRLYPIEDCYLEPFREEDLADTVARAVDFASDLDKMGDILVFLPGEREIRECAELLTGRRLARTQILPLFGRLSAAEQMQVFHRSNWRKIVLATNVAETSITIPGIKFVIDSGLVRLSRFNPRTRIQELQLEKISQSSARQRRGRCGRVQDGVCIHLYREDELAQFAEFTVPELQRRTLAGVILQMAALGLPEIEHFPFPDPPSGQLIREGLTTLTDLGALNSSVWPQRKLSKDGEALSRLPIDPHLGKMLLTAQKLKVLPELLIIAAYLSIQDPGERPFDHAKAADDRHRQYEHGESDFIGILQLYFAFASLTNSALRKFCRDNYYNFRRMREWKLLAAELGEFFQVEPAASLEDALRDVQSLHLALLSGIPRQLAVYDPEEKCYRNMNGRKLQIFPGSGLARLKKPHREVMFFHLMETSLCYGRICAAIEHRHLSRISPGLCRKSYDRIHLDCAGGFVYARERLTCGTLLIHPGRQVHYADIDPVECRKVLIRDGLMTGALASKVPWIKQFYGDLNLCRNLEVKMRRNGSLVSEDALFAALDAKLPPEALSEKALSGLWQKNRTSYAPSPEEYLFDTDDLQELENYPDELVWNQCRTKLDYVFDPGTPEDGITVHIEEKYLNLFNPHLPGFLVPGLLGRKVELMLKSLPKECRRVFSPLQECVQDFCRCIREKKLSREQSIEDALREYLKREYDLVLGVDCFASMPELPEYLVMKIAICQKDGKVLQILREYPDLDKVGSRVSGEVILAGTAGNSGHPWWPAAGELPERTVLPDSGNKTAYPALCLDNGKLESGVYLDELEALKNHRQAVLHLFRNAQKTCCDYWKRQIKVSRNTELELFCSYRQWQQDVLDTGILQALPDAPEKIRSAAQFDALQADFPENLALKVQTKADELEKLAEQSTQLRRRIAKLPAHTFTRMDLERQLDCLLAPGFLKFPELYTQYSRIFKAIAIRLDRTAGGTFARDEAKAEPISDDLDFFYLALDQHPLERNPALLEFLLLLEECRIFCFAPELGCRIRGAVKKLAEARLMLKLRK